MQKVWVLFILLWLIPSAAIADTIVLVANKWCPYNCIPATAQPGYIVEIARVVYERAGYKFTYKLLPWKRAVSAARKGEFNGIIGFTSNTVKGFITTKTELGITQDAFFVKKEERWRYKDIASLKKIGAIGYPLGYHYTPEIDDYFQHAKNIFPVPGDNPLIPMVKMLLLGRINTFPENVTVMKYFLDETDQTDKVVIAGEFHRSNVYAGFGLRSPTHQRDMRILSDGIQTLRNTGELETILNRYGLQDWRP